MKCNDPDMIVTSPTYLLDNTYQAEDGSILHHMDLYRLSSNTDLSFLSIPKIFSDSICLIEWPDRLGAHLPDSYLLVSIYIKDDDSRYLVLTPVGNLWLSRAAALKTALQLNPPDIE